MAATAQGRLGRGVWGHFPVTSGSSVWVSHDLAWKWLLSHPREHKQFITQFMNSGSQNCWQLNSLSVVRVPGVTAREPEVRSWKVWAPSSESAGRSENSDHSNRTFQKDQLGKTKVRPSCAHRTRCSIYSPIWSLSVSHLVFPSHCGLDF